MILVDTVLPANGRIGLVLSIPGRKGWYWQGKAHLRGVRKLGIEGSDSSLSIFLFRLLLWHDFKASRRKRNRKGATSP